MSQRRRNWFFVAGGLLILWLVHPFYVRNFEAFMEKRGWDQILNDVLADIPGLGANMDSYFSDLFSNFEFWAGAFAILMVWGFLEILYGFFRRIRRIQNPFMRPSNKDMSAYVRFLPESGTIESSYNVTSVSDNGTGDFTVTFERPISETLFAVFPLFDARWPSKVIVNSKNARVDSVRVKYRREPDVVGLIFES